MMISYRPELSGIWHCCGISHGPYLNIRSKVVGLTIFYRIRRFDFICMM
jgi:hypothetical protein